MEYPPTWCVWFRSQSTLKTRCMSAFMCTVFFLGAEDGYIGSDVGSCYFRHYHLLSYGASRQHNELQLSCWILLVSPFLSQIIPVLPYLTSARASKHLGNPVLSLKKMIIHWKTDYTWLTHSLCVPLGPQSVRIAGHLNTDWVEVQLHFVFDPRVYYKNKKQEFRETVTFFKEKKILNCESHVFKKITSMKYILF